MRRSLALMAVAVLSALSLTACFSEDEPQCFLTNVGSTPTPVPCDSPSIVSTTSASKTTTTSTTTTAAPTTTTTTTTPTPTSSTVTVQSPSPTTTVGTVTVYAPPPTTTTVAAPPPAAEPRFNDYVSVGQSALCGGSRIESYDSGGVTLNDANAVFRTNGFSLSPVSYPAPGTPPFTFAGVIVTQAGTETSFSGNLLFAPDGNLLTSANAGYGDFWLNSSIQADGFVFCDSTPTLR